MADGSSNLSELPNKSFRIVEAAEDVVTDSTCIKSSDSVLGPTGLGLVGLTTANYEEVASEIAQASNIGDVCPDTTNGSLQSSMEIAKYEDASSGIVIGGSVEDPNNIATTITTVAANVIAQATNLAVVCSAPVTDSLQPSVDIRKYEEAGNDIVVVASGTPNDIQTTLTGVATSVDRSSEQESKHTIDSEEIAKLVEVTKNIENHTAVSPQPTVSKEEPDFLETPAKNGAIRKGTGKYVPSLDEARKVIEAHEILTGTKYVLWRGLSGFGNSAPKSKGKRILWQEMRKSNDPMRHGIERDGVPFMVCGEIIYDCVHGNDTHKSWKTLYAKRVKEQEDNGTPVKTRKRISLSKKVGCPARIYLKEVIRFPDYMPPKFTEFHKKETSRRLRKDIDSENNVRFERRVYISLPTIDEHKYHFIGGNMAEVSQITYRAPVNIAVVKYWGKRNTALNLPLNSSLSVTLGLNEMYAKTTVAISKNFNEDKFWLNGKKQDIKKNERIQKCLKELRRMARKRKGSKDKDCLSRQHVHICSENNFPTAAGLASSAAGYACLTTVLSKLLGVNAEVSHIARQGSGSACRSMYGGFVKWNRGEVEDGLDSIAVQIASERHWPELKVLVAVVSDQKKKVSSTEGMQRSAATSELLWYRAAYVVPMRMEEMEKAIIEKDFDKFAELTMKESSQLHAVCLDTFPSIEPPYLNETSHQIMELVTVFNESSGRMKAAFTFDAGPNAFIFTTDEFLREFISLFDSYFRPAGADGESFFRGLNRDDMNPTEIDPNVVRELEHRKYKATKGSVKYVICTKSGPGPEELSFSESLLNPFGLPIEDQNLCDNTMEQSFISPDVSST